MENKKKMNSTLITVALVVLALACVFAVLVFTGVIGGDGKNLASPDESTTDNQLPAVEEIDVKSVTKFTSTDSLPYLETEIDGIYYTVSQTGEVKFFKFAENKFTPVEATGTYDVSVELSEQDVSTTVTYYKQDDLIAGYGLYLGKTDEFDLYPYAFFALTNYGENYSKASTSSCLLLVDTTEDDFYSNDKIFEEPFVFTYSNSSASRLLSEANRTVGLDGAKRDDYTLITQATINASTSHFLFFSGRYYGEEDPVVDLMRSGGSGNNTDNIRIAKDVLGYWLENSDDGISYLTTDANGDVIIEKYVYDTEETETIKTFTDVKRDGIIVRDDYIYIKNTNTVYSIKDAKEIKIAYEKASEFTADMFVCKDGKIAVRGYLNKLTPVLIIASSDGKVTGAYPAEFFRTVVNPIVVNEDIILTSQGSSDFSYYIF